MEQYLDRIRRLELIEHLPRKVQDEILAQASRVLYLEPGDEIFAQDQEDSFVSFLLRGRVDSIVDGTTRAIIDHVADHQFGPLDPEPRKHETLRARTSVTVLRVDRRELERTYQQIVSCEGDGSLEVVDIATDGSTDWQTRLLRSALFLRLSASAIHTVFDRMAEVDVKAGEDIVHQGDPGDFYYVLQAGLAAVHRRPVADGREVHLADLVPGDGFGEEALISGAPRNATVRMITDGTLMRLGKADFLELLVEPLVRGVSFRQGRWLVEQGAAWVDARDSVPLDEPAPDGVFRIPLHLLRVQARRLDLNRSYVVCGETVSKGVLAAFQLAARGFDASYLETPFSPELTLSGVPGPARPEVESQEAESASVEIDQMSEQNHQEKQGNNGANRHTHTQPSSDDVATRIDRDEYADTFTGIELAELIDELYRQRAELEEAELSGGDAGPAVVRATDIDDGELGVSGWDFSGDELAADKVVPVSDLARAPDTSAGDDAGTSSSLVNNDKEDLAREIIREVDTGLNEFLTQFVAKRRVALEALIETRLAKIEQQSLDRILNHERELQARYESAYNEKAKKLTDAYDQLTSLANRISRQKAEIQKARKTLEIKLRAANRVHREVFELGNSLVRQVDHLELFKDDSGPN
jgi:CRP-like cAMP-binding protein